MLWLFLVYFLKNCYYYTVNTVDQQRELADYVDHEEIMIIDTDAIVYPGTVMIKTLDTPMTYSTVAGSDSSQNLALWTHLSCIKLLHQS
jgi:formylmethanofuran dehydrogenase subunit A